MVYAGLFIANAYFEIYYLDSVFVKIWELSDIMSSETSKEVYFTLGRALSSFGVMRTVPFLAFWVLVYFLPPVYLLTSPKVRKYLC